MNLNPNLQLFKKILPYFVALIVGAILWSLIPKCGADVIIPDNRGTLKDKIKTEIKAGDSIKKIVKKNDSVRIEYVIRWRKLKADTIKIPCDSMLAKVIHACDTIILVDSVEISNLKRVVANDSIIIKDLFSVVRIDSVQLVVKSDSIKGLSKQLRRAKRRTKLALVLAGALGIGLIIK